MTDRPGDLLARRKPLPADSVQSPALAFQSGDLGLGQQFDVGKRRNALDQVARHARGKVRSAYDHPYFRHLARQIHRSLTRGIAAAHEHYLLTCTQPSLQWRGPVMDG